MTRNNPIKLLFTGLLIFVLLFSALPLDETFAAGPSVFINEIHYDNDSTDADETIEIAGPAGTDLSGWSLVLYNGSATQLNVYNTINLSGIIPDQQNGYGTLAFSQAGIQNGSPDGLALVDDSGSVVQFLSYEGSFTAVDGPADGMTSVDIGVFEPEDTPVGHSLQLTGNGSGYGDFTWDIPQANTFSGVNTGQNFESIEPSYTPIYDIQYTEDPSGDSLYMDQTDITTEGVVTAIFYNGYFIEDPDGGAWNGLWVYDSNTPALSDRVRLTGTVIEYNNLTQLGNLTSYEVLSNGNPLPAPVVQPSVGVSQEMWESVLVRVENVTVTNEDLGYGEWSVSDGSGDVVIDDKGSYTYVPTAGDALDAVIGPLDYSYGAFKIQPRDDNDIIQPAVTPDVIINEVDSDTPSYDALEFIELYDGGAGNTALDGFVVVLYNGKDDKSYTPALDLDGYSTDTNGYFVIGSVAGADIYVAPGSSGWLQNGADAVALYVGDAADFPNDTPVTTDGLLDAIVYDTNDGDDAALLVLLNTGQPQVNEDGADDKDNHSNQRCPDGSGGARNTDAYAQFLPTPGAENACVLPPPDVIINEVDADQVSTDAAEFVELYDYGVGNTDLSGLVLVLFNGSDDASYLAFDLDGYSTNGDGYFVLCGDAGNVANCDLDVSPDTNLIQNGADAVALYVGDEVDFPNDTPVTPEGLIDAIVYDTNDDDDAALLVLLNAEQPQVNERDGGDGTAHSNQRCPDGSGGPRNTDTYAQFDPTPGAKNTCLECGFSYTPIYTIQGSGFASLLDGTQVDVEGIVTGDFQEGKSGFTIQDPLGDGDTATSDGIFIYASSPDVNVGDHVRVTGYVDEYYELTEITGVSYFELCSTGNSVAATPISLPVTDVSDLEAYEGMLVTFPQPLFISEYYNFSRYGEIVLSTERQFQPTSEFEPGSQAAADALVENLLSRIKLDDGRGSQNPDPALHPNGSIFDLSNLFRGGDVLNNLTGVVDYSYGEYKIQPTIGADYVNANPRTVQPDDVGGNLIVASFNVLNYFTSLDDGVNDICGPNQNLECRGADTDDEFTRQRTKIIAALAAMDADVVGLIEIENNEFEAVADLVNGLNDAVGAGTYAYVDTGYIGTDAIKVAFIYKTGTVSLVGDHAILDESVDSRFIDTKNRPSLAQSFMDNDTGGIFTVVVNHLKSKGSSCASIGDPDLGDGAGNCNLTRTAAAEALVDWLATDPTNSGDADFLIIGDLNAYDKEDPIDAILAGGYDDLVFQYLGEDAYSYVFDGQLGYLDHALVMGNGGLGSQITGATVWHINADEASLIDYDMSYKQDAQDAIYAPDPYRSSDHDPVLIGLNVSDEIAPTMEITLSTESLWPANHKYVDVTATVIASDNFDPNPVVTLLSVTSSELDDEPGDGDGSTVDDIVIIDDFNFQLRAERSATAQEGRVYTITYMVEDACGNQTIESVTVLVPFSQKK